jgi:hypothetical protein
MWTGSLENWGKLLKPRSLSPRISYLSIQESPTNQCGGEQHDEGDQNPGVTRSRPRANFVRPTCFLPSRLLNHLW